MRQTRLVPALLLLSLLSLGCQPPAALGEDGRLVFRQGAISDIACGPSSLFNWLSHGGDDLQGILATLSTDRTSKQTVQHLIDTYGKRQSATNPSVVRYGRHNGGVGSVNLMVMARELLGDHLESPPSLRGEYLQRDGDESPSDHLQRVGRWFSTSLDSGVPVILYLRRYERTAENRRPRMVFGHHVVVTQLEEAEGTGGEASSIRFRFADSASGRVDRGQIVVAAQEFTAPTFTYRFEGDRALTDEELRTGLPSLEVQVDSYESRGSRQREIMLAHFATFAEVKG